MGMTCAFCDELLPPAATTGRPRRFCSDTCRQKAYQDRVRFGFHRVLRFLVERQDKLCPLCTLPLDTSIRWGPLAPCTDHAIPVSRAGADDLRNIQAVHVVCNQRKGDKL